MDADRPTDDEYSLSYFTSDDPRFGYRDYLGTELRQRRATAAELVRHVAEIAGLGHGSRVLDVGAGPGIFVRAFRDQGIDCEGLEPARDVAQRGRELFDVPLHGCTLRQFVDSRVETSRRFDLVTLFDVIEHVDSPADFLAMLGTMLNLGGCMFLTTPRFQGRLYELQGLNYVQFKRDHIWYFSERGLKRLLADAGLRRHAIYDGDYLSALRTRQIRT